MRHILFGDSIGFGVGDYHSGGWATQLRLHIDQQKQSKDHNLINLSISGDNSRGILARIKQEAALRMRDNPPTDFTFIIAIGTNDSRINRGDLENNISPAEFANNINKIISIASSLSSEVILIGLVPVDETKTTPYKENKHYTLARISEYNQILKETAITNSLKFVDLFPVWLAQDFTQLLADGLHPNSLGHKLIFETVKSQLFE